ncbi:MAG: restriction endonuclease [Pseudomonadota bacterium]
MTKLGKQFELVVADIIKEFDPDVLVRQGEWIQGPDGKRELDVYIEGSVNSIKRRVQIECRDYDPQTRPIGISHIDALDSKHRDLQIDVSFLCSNAGFTKDAKTKAHRLGIKLVGALRTDDPRIRYRVFDKLYIRRVNIVPQSLNIKIDFLTDLPPQGNMRVEEIMFEGRPIYNWLLNRIAIFLGANPVVKGSHSLCFRFKQPAMFVLPSGYWLAKSMRVEFSLDGSWIEQEIEIDAESGLYDWIHQAVQLSPNSTSVIYKNIEIGSGGNSVSCPPNFDWKKLILDCAGMSIWAADIGGLSQPTNIPNMDRLIVDKDLEMFRKNIPKQAYYS